jgi:hypothetical protein
VRDISVLGYRYDPLLPGDVDETEDQAKTRSTKNAQAANEYINEHYFWFQPRKDTEGGLADASGAAKAKSHIADMSNVRALPMWTSVDGDQPQPKPNNMKTLNIDDPTLGKTRENLYGLGGPSILSLAARPPANIPSLENLQESQPDIEPTGPTVMLSNPNPDPPITTNLAVQLDETSLQGGGTVLKDNSKLKIADGQEDKVTEDEDKPE